MKQRKIRKLNNKQAWGIVLAVIGIVGLAIFFGLIIHGSIVVNRY